MDISRDDAKTNHNTESYKMNDTDPQKTRVNPSTQEG